MKATKVQWIRQNEVNDIFSYVDDTGAEQFTSFPRSMELTTEDVEDFIENTSWYN